MPESNANVKIRVKSGDSEAEIESPLADLREAISLIPEVLAKLPQASTGRRPAIAAAVEQSVSAAEESGAAPQAPGAPSSVPTVNIDKGDSLSDVISKFFSDYWGRSPRKLMEVREALQSYGLNYPKQSVAVALLRLAKGSKIRRFKGEGGEYVYTAATGAVRLGAPAQTPATPESEEPEAAHSTEVEASQEDQLNLDAPAAN